jgi:hypothetical protein
VKQNDVQNTYLEAKQKFDAKLSYFLLFDAKKVFFVVVAL